MRLRLVIPAALAAVATYTALVRDDVAVGTADGEVSSDRMAPRDVPAPRSAPETAHTTGAPATPPPAAGPSPYFDLAPSPASDLTKPSVYDLLAGEPPPPAPVSTPIAPSSVDAQTEPEPEAAPVAQADVAPPDQVVETQTEPEPEAAPVAQANVAPPDQVVETQTEPEPEAAPVAQANVAPPALVEDIPVSVGEEPRLRVVEEAVGETSSPAGPGTVLDEGRFALGGWAAAAGHSMVSAVTFHSRLSEDIAAERIVLDIEASDNVPDGGLVVLNDPGFAPDRDGFTLLLAAADPGPFSAAGSYRVLAS